MNRTHPHPQAKTPDDASKDVDQAVRDEEARKLKAIYREKKRDNPSLTQEHIADLCEWSGQSVVSQYLNGRIPLNLPALLKFSKVLGFNISDVSPRLAAPLMPAWTGDAQQVESEAPPTRRQAPDLQPIEVWDDETPLGADEVELPFFKESEISAGKGSQVTLEIHGRKLRFGKRTLRRKNIDPQAAGCVPVTGNSMEPVLPDGSTVGVDTAAVTVQDGKMYAIDHDGQLRVKLLYRIPGGGLRLRSYNDAEHPDERYDKDYVEQHIRVIGKVFWYSVLL
ncbi:LexA family transcriptional regulator [Pseudomonas guariconensis]|uniref:XRE family transcriptional regulator n=1 Tax=Pseudomonas guariconensis TaxID=1288410 RepID=A0AAX0VT70_9PSED|nr:helix-turn-helix transcriptional regulator [Pseudomonas guariconensis]PLV17732.1 XRE family transcriptional regulator [Pseudomonas guariconensis]PLV22680.1 XRE family transcriptional regulator [Pseudomonas guariconensis]PLV27703.1 XRE family transcriptional regulator [Pseudomonas guariconensis]